MSDSELPASSEAAPGRRARLAASTPALDEAECRWWERNSDVEEEYCWVQTPWMQRRLRGHYLRKIAAPSRGGTRVLELGCGTGWLSLLLAEYGWPEVHGADLSEVQIERARTQAAERGLGERVQFHHVTRGLGELAARLPGTRFDALVIHGVLHHLSDEEVREVLSTFVERLAAPGAAVFILEPVQYRAPEARPNLIDRWVDRLILLPRFGQRSGVRRVSEQEARLIERIDTRGDSPKETPFLPGELERLAEPFLRLEHRTPVLSFSYLAAKNLLLFGVTYPQLSRAVRLPYLLLTRAVEAALLRAFPAATRFPTFELYTYRVRPDLSK